MSAAPRFLDKLSPPLLKGLDLLWQYREGIGVVIGLLLLVMIVDNLVAIHRELEHLRITVQSMARRPKRGEQIDPDDLTVDSEGWRAD